MAWQLAMAGGNIADRSLVPIPFQSTANLIVLFQCTMAGGQWEKEMDSRDPDRSDFLEWTAQALMG